MITALAGIGNWRTGEIVLANAGHPPPLLVTADQADYVRFRSAPRWASGRPRTSR